MTKTEARRTALKSYRLFPGDQDNKPLIVQGTETGEWLGYGQLTEEKLWDLWSWAGGPIYEEVLP